MTAKSKPLDPLCFRMYDIRGKADLQIHEDLAYGVGRALGSRIVRSGGTTAAVGRDVRHSSPLLAKAVATGLAECGLKVFHLGQVPTPVLYHSLYRLECGGGVMVTGSHNPKSDNGLKLCLGTAGLYGEAVSSLKTQIEAQDFETGAGEVQSYDYLPEYFTDLCSRFSFGRKLKVAIDCGNGVMGPVVLEALSRLSVEVVPLYCEPDGDFPNHLPDPEVPKYMEDLGKMVVSTGADLGLGFDGDGDRVGVLDENGKKMPADWLVALFARTMLKDYPGGKVRYDVKCSDFLETDVRAHGGVPVMGETGHSLLKRDIKASDAILGGELSGHIVMNRDYLPIDDSLYCALFLLKIFDATTKPLSALFADFPDLVSTAEIKVPCGDTVKFDVVKSLVESFQSRFPVIDIDGARVRFSEGTWFLVRASNTTPNLTVRFEAPTLSDLSRAKECLITELARFGKDVGIEALQASTP